MSMSHSALMVGILLIAGATSGWGETITICTSGGSISISEADVDSRAERIVGQSNMPLEKAKQLARALLFDEMVRQAGSVPDKRLEVGNQILVGECGDPT